MKSKSFVACAFAGTILATTVGTANSTTYYANHRLHHWQGRIATPSAHQRVTQRSSAAHRNDDSAAVAGLAAGGSAGGLMSGIASIYSGGRTANGEFAAAGGLTAAHRTLPFGTRVRVDNIENGRSVVVRINDRGPTERDRVIDVSRSAAAELGLIQMGIAEVRVTTIERSTGSVERQEAIIENRRAKNAALRGGFFLWIAGALWMSRFTIDAAC